MSVYISCLPLRKKLNLNPIIVGQYIWSGSAESGGQLSLDFFQWDCGSEGKEEMLFEFDPMHELNLTVGVLLIPRREEFKCILTCEFATQA